MGQTTQPVKPARQPTRRDLADAASSLRAQVVALAERLTQAEARGAEARTRADQAERERNLAAQDRERATAWAMSAEGEARALRAALAEAQAALAEARRPAWRRLFGMGKERTSTNGNRTVAEVSHSSGRVTRGR